MHTTLSVTVGTSVQVAVVWLVVVGQQPQFDARMLYSTAGQLTAVVTGLQVKIRSFCDPKSDSTGLIFRKRDKLLLLLIFSPVR
jgi:hypothetical protein